MNVTAFDLAQRFVGLREAPGLVTDNPAILAMLRLDQSWPDHDEVPWCSAYVNLIAWLLRLPRSKSLVARSWLTVGQPVELPDAKVGFDVVVLARNGGGHVGFYAGQDGGNVFLLGGNQADAVNVSTFSISRVLGVRRLA